MKHLITFICLVTLSIAGMQNAKAQTKEETIDWLNTNGRNLFNSRTKYTGTNFTLKYTFSFDRIENGNAIFNWDVYDSRGRNPNIKHIIPVNSILYQDLNTLSTKKR